MVVAARLAYLRERAAQGHPIALSVLPGSNGGAAYKVKATLLPKTSMAGESHIAVVDKILDILVLAAQNEIVTDRGHQHSSGKSVTTLWYRPPPQTPAPVQGWKHRVDAASGDRNVRPRLHGAGYGTSSSHATMHVTSMEQCTQASASNAVGTAGLRARYDMVFGDDLRERYNRVFGDDGFDNADEDPDAANIADHGLGYDAAVRIQASVRRWRIWKVTSYSCEDTIALVDQAIAMILQRLRGPRLDPARSQWHRTTILRLRDLRASVPQHNVSCGHFRVVGLKVRLACAG